MEEDGSAIEGLIPKIQSAFDKYTKGAVSVIDKQNGGLNSTYEILQQLSKVYPNLTDEAMAYINEVVAGNRQNKVLVSILENWQNVEKAVQSATNSLGSANSENEKFLNSIQGRMSQLSSSTEMFWKNFIDSELIKEGVDTLNSLVQIMDTLVNNSFSEFLIQAGLISTTFILMNKGAKALGDSLAFTAIKVTLLDIKQKGLLATTKALTATMLASPLFWVIAGFAIIKAVDALTTSLKEQKEIVETLNSELQVLQSEYDNLKANPNRTEEQTKYLGLLEKELEIKKELLKIETKKTIDKEFFTNYLPTANDAKSYNPTTRQIEYGDTSGIGKINESIAKLIELQNELANASSKEAYDTIKEKILSIQQSLTNSLKDIKKYNDIMGEDMPEALLKLSYAIEDALGINNDLINSNNNVNKSFNDTIVDLTNLHKTLAKTLNDSRSEIMDINEVLNSYNENKEFTESQMSKLIEKYPQLLYVLHDEKKLYEELKKIQKEKVAETQRAFNAELESLKNSINEKTKGYEIDFNNYKSLEETKLKITKDMVSKVLQEYDKIYNATGDDMKAELHARKTRKYLKDSLGSAIPEIDAYLNLQKFDVGKFVTSIDSKQKKPKEEWVSSLEVRYRSLQAVIDSLNKTLDINQEKLNQTDSEVDKINILKQQIEIYKQLQVAMQNMNTERRKEREEIIKQLQNSGISSAKIIDDVGIITDLKQISNLTGESGKKVEELVKRLDSSNSSIRQGSMEWWKYQSSIVGAINEIDNLIKAIQEAEEKAFQDMLSAISDVENKIIQIIKKRGEIEREELEKSHKADMESLEERHKAKMDSYKEELESFRKMIQGQIDELDRQYAEEDYMKQLQEERDKATEIQRQIDILSLDDSLEARNKTIELRKELADQNEKIADMQTKRERDILKKNLQDQLKDKEEYIRKLEDKENASYERSKQKLDNNYNRNKGRLDREYSDYQVYIEAKQALEDGYVLDFEGKMVSLEEAYIKFEDRFGAGLGILGEKIKNDFIAKIEDAISAVKKLQNMSISAGSGGGSGSGYSGGGSLSNMSESDLQKYLNYKEIWDMANKTGNETAKKEANKAAQALRDKYGITSDDYSYEELKKKGYKVGGVIDYTGDAIVHGSKTSAEVVFSASDAKKLWEYVKALPTVPTAQIPKVPYGTGTGLGSIIIENIIGKVEGNLDKSVVPDIYKTVKVAINEVFDARKRELDKRGQIVFR